MSDLAPATVQDATAVHEAPSPPMGTSASLYRTRLATPVPTTTAMVACICHNSIAQRLANSGVVRRWS